MAKHSICVALISQVLPKLALVDRKPKFRVIEFEVPNSTYTALEFAN